MLGSTEPGLLAPLSAFLLIGGAFSVILLKALKAPKVVTRIYSYVFVIVSLVFSFWLYIETSGGDMFVYTVGGFPPPIGIVYQVDGFSALFGLVIAILFAVFYPLIGVLSDANEYFYALFLGLEAGMLGVVYTGDLFNSFVMLEVLTISALGLIAMSKTRDSYVAVYRYGILMFITGILYFFAAALMYFATGTLSIGYIAAWNYAPGILAGKSAYIGASMGAVIGFILLLLTWSLIAEEALAPLHFWLPDAYSSAPPVIAGLLAGVGEAVGYYLMLRFYYTIYAGVPWSIAVLLRVLGIITIIIGGFGIVYSDRLLKMISYSVILDTGYIALAVSIGPQGVPVVLSYVIAHAIVKPLLFISAGWARQVSGTDKLDGLSGVFRSSKLMQVGFVSGALAVIGIPPTILFAAKLELYINMFNSLLGDPLMIIAIIAAFIGSGLAAAGFIKAVSATILSPNKRSFGVKPGIKAYVLLLTLAVFAFGLLYPVFHNQVIVPASNILVEHRDAYINEILKLIPQLAGG